MSVIDEYLANFEAPQRAALERIRKIVHDVAPEAEEVITYGMPGFKYNGKYLIAFAPFKHHMSIFPASEPIEVLKDRLGRYQLSKGTIQFTLDNPVSKSIIRELILIRISSFEKKKTN